MMDLTQIFGVEVKSTQPTKQEKAALQLMELRAKTASIKKSLPDWVKDGLVPPKRHPSPPAAVETKNWLSLLISMLAKMLCKSVACRSRSRIPSRLSASHSTAQVAAGGARE